MVVSSRISQGFKFSTFVHSICLLCLQLLIVRNWLFKARYKRHDQPFSIAKETLKECIFLGQRLSYLQAIYNKKEFRINHLSRRSYCAYSI
jgi:hypothetical protein